VPANDGQPQPGNSVSVSPPSQPPEQQHVIKPSVPVEKTTRAFPHQQCLVYSSWNRANDDIPDGDNEPFVTKSHVPTTFYSSLSSLNSAAVFWNAISFHLRNTLGYWRPSVKTVTRNSGFTLDHQLLPVDPLIGTIRICLQTLVSLSDIYCAVFLLYWLSSALSLGNFAEIRR
jgi:hypothetical protein